jgi:hypothetical protein
MYCQFTFFTPSLTKIEARRIISSVKINKINIEKHYIFSHRFGECGRSWWLQEIAMKAGWLHDIVMGVCDFRKLR